MLTKFEEGRKIKAHRYWPAEVGQSGLCFFLLLFLKTKKKFENKHKTNVKTIEMFGRFLVSFTKERIPIKNLYRRHFDLTYNGETRKVVHLQYTEWPDMVEKEREMKRKEKK